MKKLPFLVALVAGLSVPLLATATGAATDPWRDLLATSKAVPGSELPASLQGKVVVVNVWATWCQPCIEEFAQLNGLVDRYRERNVVFVAVTAEGASRFEDLLAKKPFRYLQLASGQKAIEAIVERASAAGFVARTNARPLHGVVGPDGTLRYFLTGYESSIDQTLAAEIDRALATPSTKP